MMDTKKRIQETALALFNKQGIGRVTVRDIAKEMGISHGNLCYHYPTVDDVIKQLYFNLVEELDLAIAKMHDHSQLSLIGEGGRTLFDLLYKYKFLMLDFVDVMRRMPEIKRHYRKLQERRKAEFRQIFLNLVDAGIMRAELYPGYFEELTTILTMVGDAWVAHAEILYAGKEKEKLGFYFRVTHSLLAPALTAKGLAAFVATRR